MLFRVIQWIVLEVMNQHALETKIGTTSSLYFCLLPGIGCNVHRFNKDSKVGGVGDEQNRKIIRVIGQGA